MRDIYSNAKIVFSWISPRDGNIPLAFDLFSKMLTVLDFNCTPHTKIR
jgi:hypothetical protein